ncbi:PAS domain S-box protein [Fictibacillus halophilus]|uniref:PAS domain-containing sensor histidine kinase n=1 Tax=Fictibacillus halophilus TaxID=1610490 RepID=UPI003629840D
MKTIMHSKKRKESEDGTILVREDGRIESMNSIAENLFGTARECYDGEHIKRFLPEILLSELREGTIIQQYGKHEQGWTFPVPVRVTSFRLHDHNYYLFITQDLKDHERIGRELYQPLKELEDMKFALDRSTIVAITDAKGKIKYVNDKFVEISKYAKDELIGKDHRIINSGYHSKAFMRELWQTISQGKVWNGEVKNRAKDGTYYWVDTTIVPFLDEEGKPYQYLAIRKEVTEYKRVLDELERSMQELVDYKFALDESSIVAITDNKGVIRYVNERFCFISKYTKEELIGQDHSIINSGYHPKEFFKNLWKTIGSGKVWKGEIQNRAKDGSIYWVDTTIVPFLNENGKPYQYVAIRSEITERKRVEQELKNMTTKILNVQEEERKSLSRNLHDGIGQNLYSHLITINRLSSEIAHPLIEQMQKETAELIEEVREISWELRPSVLDDLGLLPAIRSFLNRYTDHYKIAVKFECVLHRRLDMKIETTIYRVIQEALTNIRKYACVEEAIITIREMDDVVRVMVEDKGKGFEEKNHASGVGLFSMEERARSVDGTLHLHSSPGEGTRVILEVPCECT